jgi:benzoate membrane transport protein
MSTVPSVSSVRWNDLTHPVVAGLISVIVNYGGTFILVFQAAKVAGLEPGTDGLVGVVDFHRCGRDGDHPELGVPRTDHHRLVNTGSGVSGHGTGDTPYAEAVGAYLISAAAFVVLGLSGWFERVIRLIPPGVAAGLLAGILLQFGIGAFGGMNIDPLLAGLLIVAYVVLKRFTARYAVVGIWCWGWLPAGSGIASICQGWN